jgi:geranylgeranyl pyrophosphate synthase
MHIKDFKRKFDKQFNSLINDKIKESRKILSRPRVQKIIDYVHVFIFSGGKRIRPYLTYLSYTSLG